VLNENIQSINVLKNASLFLDKNSTKTISDFFQNETIFTPISKKFINRGYMFKDTLWLKFEVKNSSKKELVKYLVFDFPNIDVLNLYFLKNAEINVLKNGIFNRRAFKGELSFRFPISLAPNEMQVYYLEIKPKTHSLHFNLKIEELVELKNDELKNQLILTIFFAILFVVIVYNLILYFKVRDILYLYYSLFILAFFIHQLSIKGMIAYFLPNNPEIIMMHAYMPIYNLTIVIVTMFLFVKKFLNLHKYRVIDGVLKSFMVIVVVILIFHSKDNYLLHYMTILAFLFVLYLECIGIYLFLKKREKYAKYFFIIWSISLTGIIGTIFYYAGFLLYPIPYLLELTFTTEVLFFSIVIATKINDSKAEKLKKERIILEQSKFVSMGEMLQNISHQWRQPLTEINAVAMKIDADFTTRRLDVKSLELDLQRIENVTNHLSQTVDSFSTYFKESKELDSTTIEKILCKALDIMKSKLENIDVEIVIEDRRTMLLNTSDFIQVILVVLNNAIDAMNLKNIVDKKITICIKQVEQRSILEIEDNGKGIKKEILDKIFEPYFTTKFKSDGIGIGLYMAKRLVEDSLKGEINAENTKTGAKLSIKL
jgi:signal transduction histidine kinase